MRIILMFLIFIISTSAYEKEVDRSIIINKTIRNASPNLNSKFSKHLAKSILKSSIKWKIDWRIMVGILQQESSFRTDPQQCLLKNKKCIDYGIAQINFATWGKELSLNKNRLVRDVDYNIDTMGHILFLMKQSHEHEKNYYSRYHSATPHFRRIYELAVIPKIKIAKSYAKVNYYE